MMRSDLRDAYQAAIDAELEYQVELAHTWLRILGESDENTATNMVALDERLVALQRAWLEAAADRDCLLHTERRSMSQAAAGGWVD